MADTVSKAIRSRIMARVRGANTKPEIALRKVLFARGFRYGLHGRRLPGKPDLVSPKYKAVIFVHGCFWHWHGCARCRMPVSNADYWRAKIARNRARDDAHVAELQLLGWRVLIVWECALKARMLGATADDVMKWLRSDGESVRYIEPS